METDTVERKEILVRGRVIRLSRTEMDSTLEGLIREVLAIKKERIEAVINDRDKYILEIYNTFSDDEELDIKRCTREHEHSIETLRKNYAETSERFEELLSCISSGFIETTLCY